MFSLPSLGGHHVSVIIWEPKLTTAQRPALSLPDELLNIPNSEDLSISAELKAGRERENANAENTRLFEGSEVFSHHLQAAAWNIFISSGIHLFRKFTHSLLKA